MWSLARVFIHLRRVVLYVAILVGVCKPAEAESIIKEPGKHPDYSFELEPHFVWTWGWLPNAAQDGLGIGVRASVPLFHNGPIDKINNNMAITFGLDWAHSSSPCGPVAPYPGYAPPPGYFYYYYNNYNCSANSYWVPVALQWNFFLTDVISVFGEPGFAIVHDSWSQWQPCPVAGGACDIGFSNTHLDFVMWGGARFLFSNTFGVTVRLGIPSASVGLSILL